MATIARGSKAAGGTSFTQGTVASATEVNTDFDTIYNEFNGGIDSDNINVIEASKIDGYSDSATERRTETNPGVTGSESDATTLPGELERIRYKLKELGTGTATARMTTAGATDIYWIDTPMTGPNLIRNGNFAVKTTAAGSAPDGWSLVLTPGTCTTTTTGVTEGPTNMRAIRIAAAGAGNEGIQQTLAGLKANTKYIVGCRAKVNAGGDIFSLTTTGASGATFGNLNLTTSSTSYVTLAGQIVTDATPTDIVVQLLAVADGDSIDVTHCWVRECSTDRLPLSNTAWAYNEITGDTANHYANGVFTDSGLTVSVVPPGPGYIIEVEAKLLAADTASTIMLCSLRENGTEVDSSLGQIDASDRGIVHFSWVNRSPTPGTTYTYTVFGQGRGVDLDRNGAAIDTETPRSWIRCRAVLEAGS